MKNSFTHLNGLIWFSSISVIIVLSCFSYGIYQFYFTGGQSYSQGFCGTPNPENLEKTFTKKAIDGKKIFQNNCASCHAKNMKTDATGPALIGVEERWADYPKEDLYNWIRNSQAMINDDHPKANELWNDWQPTVMTSFPSLTDEDIEAILEYINVIHYSDTGKTESQTIGCSF